MTTLPSTIYSAGLALTVMEGDMYFEGIFKLEESLACLSTWILIWRVVAKGRKGEWERRGRGYE